MYLLGLDIGSSSVKAAIVDARSGHSLGIAHAPAVEMDIQAPQPGWAEQSPGDWWQHCGTAVRAVLQKTAVPADQVAAIGLSYQMHGLVTLDANGAVLRPAIIWCDSRAVELGEMAFQALGETYCLEHFLNSPGNFTASKLKWVKEQEPELFERIRYFMLPGDYIAYKMTGEPATTISGLSEGILWDFQNNQPATSLLEHLGISKTLMPPLVPAFGDQGKLTASAAEMLGLKPGIPVTYRAGDQPNNAVALNVLEPGEVAATGGTSGVVYGVLDKPVYDPLNRVNSFAHVNHRAAAPRIGVLLCINGAGIQYSWMRNKMTGKALPYPEMEQLAAATQPGADGLRIIPFGNGAERMLGNKTMGAQIINLEFNRHQQGHLFRAALEGIAFSFVYGMQVFHELGLNVGTIRVGNDNLFQSAIFSSTIAQLMDARIEVLETTGAVGAAVAAGVGIGIYGNPADGLGRLKQVRVYEPDASSANLKPIFADWSVHLEKMISR
ncbi:MAG: carbohydrate kinase [Bacteroidetes bacterium]|nr:MAG: carbohydrate kinase [Bacteroidota bacterium]